MTNRKHSKEVKKRFIYAVECEAQKRYPHEREVDIIKSLGYSPPNYYRLRSTENNYPTLEHCYLLYKKYNISLEWLIAGVGPMKVSKLHNRGIKPQDLIKQGQSLFNQALTIMNGQKATKPVQ